MTASEDHRYSATLTRQQGHLVVEDVRLSDLATSVCEPGSGLVATPVFVYSRRQILESVASYTQALNKHNIPYMLGYAAKANSNPHLMQLMANAGCTLVAVSGNDLRLALHCDLDMSKVVFNGNGKLDWELELAVTHDCLINLDSTFDFQHLIKVAQRVNQTARVLMRLNPDINVQVHDYLSTGVKKSKFGVDEDQLPSVLDLVKNQGQGHITLVGMHCHLGSTITETSVFKECVEVMLSWIHRSRGQGHNSLRYLNLGGGLGIDYTQHASNTAEDSNIVNQEKTKPFPKAEDLIASVSETLATADVTLILEPGRYLVGDAGTLLTKVIGVKKNGGTNFLVVDGSMTEVIRPCLYSAYHHIELAEPSQHPHPIRQPFDVVGPVCECSDFLGKDRWLSTPHEGCSVAVFDVGAYCSSMASNYNLRPRPAEVLVDGSSWKVIRTADTFEDMMKPYY